MIVNRRTFNLKQGQEKSAGEASRLFMPMENVVRPDRFGWHKGILKQGGAGRKTAVVKLAQSLE